MGYLRVPKGTFGSDLVVQPCTSVTQLIRLSLQAVLAIESSYSCSIAPLLRSGTDSLDPGRTSEPPRAATVTSYQSGTCKLFRSGTSSLDPGCTSEPLHAAIVTSYHSSTCKLPGVGTALQHASGRHSCTAPVSSIPQCTWL